MLKPFLVFLFVLALAHAGRAQEFPFIYFPDKAGALQNVLAFNQNSNKEIIIVSPEGVYSFNGRRTGRLFNFSELQLSGIQKVHFTSDQMVVLSKEGLFSIDLETIQKVDLQKDSVTNIFYHPGEDHIYLNTPGKLALLKKNRESRTVVNGFENPVSILFAAKEYFFVGTESVNIYSTDWAFKEKLNIGEPIIDSYCSNEKLWILTASGLFSREVGSAGIEKYQSFYNKLPTCILEDKTGNMWVGTENSGVILLEGSRRKELNQNHNFPIKGLKGIYESKDFSLWFYGENGMALKPFSAPFLKFQLGKHLAGNEVQDIKELSPDKTAVLTKDGYFHIIENEVLNSSRQVSLPFVPHFSEIIGARKTLHVNRKGHILLQDMDKSFRCSIRKDIVKVFTFEEESLLVAEDGTTYLYDHSRYVLSKSGLFVSVDKILFQSKNSLIYTDAEGKLNTWDSKKGSSLAIGAYTPEMLHAGLLNEKYFVFLTEDQQLKYSVDGKVVPLDFKLNSNETVSHFFITNNNLWISTGDQLYQLGFYLKEGVLNLLEQKVFSAGEYNIQLPVFKSIGNEEGSYWLASQDHILLYHSFALAQDISRPGIVLENIYIKKQDSLVNVNFLRSDSIRLSLEKNDQLYISAFPVTYDTKNKISLNYRFSTGDTRWKKPFDKGLMLISGLEPGLHFMELISRSEEGVKSDPIHMMVEVKQEEWYNWWTILGTSVGLMLLSYFAFSGIKLLKAGNSREAREKYEKELLKLRKRSHEQMMKAEGLKQVNQLISAQKAELEEKNKQIVAQKYELSLTSSQIKKQKDVIEMTTEKLQSSITYAQRIQTALMGDEILLKEDLPESFVLLKPRDQVSGDFFWFEKIKNELGEDILIIAAVDCTGHGVPGAIVSVVGIQLLNAIVKAKGITDPGKVLTILNHDLLHSLKYEQTKMNDGMDMSLCTINLHNRKMYFAGAKNPLYIIENKELEIIKGDRFPIGGQKLREEKDFTTHEIMLQEAGKQMFYLFTDGYQDQFGGMGQSKFMAGNFKNLLKEVSDKPMMEQKYILSKNIREWQGEEDQTDDILVLGFRI